MKTEQQYFEEGKSIQTYMEEMSKLKEESTGVYKAFELPEDGFVDTLKRHRLHFLIITEDWCGDAMMINPVIRKVAEAAGVEMRVALRDADTDLIDRHLTNGGRAIPIVLILDEQGQLVGKWGPRSPEGQKLVDGLRAGLPPKEDPGFEEKQKAMYAALKSTYAEDSQLWLSVYESFKKTVRSLIG
ncbi:thioredoxin family protein [Alkalihalobacillus oceani]|uniref:thioredoxin family protein n=1 Tax=Halalkalibacter oceani TaxID=1653776 RepID=UPI00203E01B9|nr:thioredoxin family protein [Halalkalibacter oceani]MCM3761954.1 thioredoxin family protein [Halalkalibacter oceani]